MNILILGSGGRTHALAWKLVQSPQTTQLYIAPGNAGTALHGTNLNIPISDFQAIEQAIHAHHIAMLVVGPEAPLVEGLRDYLTQKTALQHLMIIGPGKQGAQLEGSKDFAKAFMQRHTIPTARYQTFTQETIVEAFAFLDTLSAPYVIKADGLAAGKGVIICDAKEEAKKNLQEILLNKKFGAAGQKVIIEEYLNGIEMSVFILTDGNTYVLLPEAKDYKRIGEGDSGPNTGGMGAISPVPFANETLMAQIKKNIITPTINGLKKEKIPYMGFIFFGLMICNNAPYVIEYNVRLGDPETEAIIPRIQSDLLELFKKCASGTLSEGNLIVNTNHCASVMLVSKGYPEAYEKGKPITFPETTSEAILFHAGTAIHDNGTVVTHGGRVMAVTALGESLEEALTKAYTEAHALDFEGKNFRRDLGHDLLKYH
ncbi:MAG: phosphoribosylamine--glycine ligase [Bacteroidales bacterium]|nr:phosphoribosylamine--glycine ligase [Bacteroidales bacterium]MDY0285933.1 phosphoribosylamine--glycine ligase [Bacteroidales bacterium]